MAEARIRLGPLERQLLDCFQRDLPLVERPFAAMARDLGTDEAEVIACLERLSRAGVVSRVGAVLEPHRAGWSTLAAMAVPASRLEAVAELVNGYEEVNHNYEREHRLNLWFVVCAPTRRRVEEVLAEIEAESGLAVLDLPLLEPFRLDLGFELQWS
jgi:DNA-binding Lrp family transcriptional regulator